MGALAIAIGLGGLLAPSAQAQDANEREAARLRAIMFPTGEPASEQLRVRAQLMSYWMLPLAERKQLYDAAMRGERRSSASAAQAVGFAAGLSAGNPLSAAGLTRGGTALAIASVASLLLPRGNDAATAFSRLYLPGERRNGTPLNRPAEARQEAIEITVAAIKAAARDIDREARCVDGCETDVQVWMLTPREPGVLRHLTVVWRRGEITYSLPDHGRNAAMPFYPRFESRGLNGWVIELSDVETGTDNSILRDERDGAMLPRLTESWARTDDGIRFLRRLTEGGYIVQGRHAQRYVAALGAVFDLGELTAGGYLPAQLETAYRD